MKTALFSFLTLFATLASTLAMAQPVPPPTQARVPGLYVSVLDGQISLANKGGSTNFTAGQFGYTASVTQPPAIVPKNPAIQFTPPPAFNQSTGPSPSGSTPGKSSTVDCEVR